MYNEKDAFYSHVKQKWVSDDSKGETRVLYMKKSANDDVQDTLYFIRMEEEFDEDTKKKVKYYKYDQIFLKGDE